MKNPLVPFQKLYLTILLIAVTLIAKAQAPSFSWSRAIAGDSTEACKIRTDSRGAVYVGGSYNSNSLQFGNTTIYNSGWNDIFLSKYDTSGNLIWVKKYGGAGQDLLSAVATDNNGDILIAGSFENSISFDAITLTSAGDKDAFYAKISKTGNVIWAKSAGGINRDAANDISTDNIGNTYICGDFSSNNFLFAGSNFQLYDAVSTNLFYAKLNMNGDAAWVKTPSIAIGTGNSLTKIKPTLSGNILLYGSAPDVSTGKLSFGVSSFTNPVNEGLSVYGMFTAEMDQSGNTINETALPIDRFQGNSINCRKNIFYSGRAGHTTQFPEGVITKLDAGANPYSMGSSSILAGPPFTSSNVLEMVEDNYQKIYFTGHYAVNGLFKAYLVSLDSDLNLISDTSINAVNQTGISTFCESIAIDTMTNIAYVAGTYSATTSFLLGTGTLNASTGSSYDGYLMKVLLPKYDSIIVQAGNDTSICAGQSVSLGATTTARGTAAPFTYSWSPAAGLNNTAVSNPAAQPAVTTKYVVTVTDSRGNTKKDSVTITVKAIPTASITASGPTTFCVGNSTTLTASAGMSYLWNNGTTTQNVLANIPGNYSVKVTGTNGCSATSPTTTVIIKPLPVVPVVLANSATSFCAGNTVTLTSPPNISYLWSNGSTAQSIVINSSGNYSVRVTDAFGCSSSSATTAVSVNPVPAIPVIAAGGLTSFCAGNNVTLTAPANTSYLWSNGNTAQSIVVNTSGNYSVKVTNAFGCSATSTPKTVTVNPLPTTPVIAASGVTSFCAGNNVTLTAPAGTSYLWSNGNSAQSIVVNTSGNYSVKVTNAFGCSATSTPKTVTVNPLPATPVIAASGVTSFCAGNNVTLTAPANTSYLWSNGNIAQSIVVNTSGNYFVKVMNTFGCSATSTPTTVTVNPSPAIPVIATSGLTSFCAGNNVTLTAPVNTSYLWSNGNTSQSIVVNASGNYSVKVTNAFGCSSTSVPKTVTVNPLPATPVIVASGVTSFCAGNNVTLTAPANTSYLWSNGNSSQSIVVNASGNYSVKVTNAFGCSATSTPKTVTVNPLPAIPVITPNRPTTFCAGDSVVLTSTANANYLWSHGDNHANTTIYNAGSFTVTHQNSFGCSSTSLPVTIVVNPLPSVPAITQAGNTLTSSAGIGNQWYSNNTSLQGENKQSVDIILGGSYKTIVTNSFGCSSSSENFTALFFRHFTTGPKVFFHQEYPNPAVSDLNISYSLQLAKKVSISIVDITGRRVLLPVKEQQQTAGMHSITIRNVGSVIGHGMYFVRYEINNVTVVQPVIIR